jgi:hypothetical protein
MKLLGQATAEPFALPRRYRGPVVALRSRWFGEWFLDELGILTTDGRFAEARALVTRHLADDTIKGQLRAMLEAVQKDLPNLEVLRRAATSAESP